jgi:putative peptide zinc metalloprotease protein
VSEPTREQTRDESADGREATSDAPQPMRPAAEADRPPAAVPQLAAGIELIGEYKESGYREPPYIARRADGQTIQMPRLLYLVAEEVDGRRDYAAIAKRVTDRFGRGVSADNVRVLVEEKLRPLGILAQADGSSPELQKLDPLLALKFRAALVPERVVRAITTAFYPFFFPPVVAAVVGGVVAFDVWLFFVHGVARSTRELLYNPVLLLVVLGVIVLATALHEIGHATAARYGGAKPGVMGAGIYVVWPAFYTDVTDAYRLDRKGRLRTDLGGVYFNAIFILATAGVYFATGFEPLLVVILLLHFQMLQQFLPFLRLDGYYVLSDLTGVPDLFARIKPTLKSILPGQDEDPRAGQLKPWVRIAVTTWVVTLVPILLVTFGLVAFNAPRLFATAWDSFFVHLEKASDAFGDGAVLSGIAGGVQMTMLALPVVGIAASFGRGGTRMLRGAWAWSSDSPLRRGAVVAATAGLVGLVAFVWWPNGEYRPIQPGEKGTIQGGAAQFRAIETGRPGLTPERQSELGGAPFQEENAPGAGRPAGDERDEEPADEQGPPVQGEEQPADTTETTPTETTETTTTETTEATETTTTETTPAETETTPSETTTTP